MDFNSLKELLPGLQQNVLLTPFTTFKVGGPAEYFFQPQTNEALIHGVKTAATLGLPLTLLSGGSNSLVADQGIQGLVIKPRNDQTTVSGTAITAGAGLSLGRLVVICAKNGLAGLEFMAGIPGTVGGGVYGNAGWPSKALGNFVTTVTVVTRSGELERWTAEQCRFQYRHTRLKEEKAVVVDATFQLTSGDPATIRSTINTHIIEKNKHQPASDASSGCIFKNPSGQSAGKLIEAAGLKGKTIGGAQVSSVHANFVINTGTATAEEIVMLVSYIKQQIRDKFKIQLMEEINYLGFPKP